MEHKLISFIILQYMASSETILCVESIRQHVGTDNYKIIIVDNDSPDNAYQVISETFTDSSDTIVLKTESNLGFAKGNNVGYQYAVKHFQPDFIVLLNNDVLLFQDDFYGFINRKFDEYPFAVFGPMILTRDGTYTSNPVSFDDSPRTEDKVLRLIKKNKVKLILARLHLLKFVSRHTHSYKKNVNKLHYLQDSINVCLHGSFMVFSKQYISSFPHGLDERTFMYGEEPLLQLHVLQAGMQTLYSPNYIVYHKEDASTDAALRGSSRKMIFTLENNLKSEYLYLDTLREYQRQQV